MTGRTRKLIGAVALSAAVAATAASSAAVAAHSDHSEQKRSGTMVSERLSGYQEDPLVISTRGKGQFEAWVNPDKAEVRYRLRYAKLQGQITQAHIHLGGEAQSGGIITFLCTNLGNGPAGTQTCPASPATITGTIRPADILTVPGQGISAGEFREFIAALRAGVTYVNVHTNQFPDGEIRAQLGEEDHHH
jgi:hypothetical protein